MPAIAPPPRGKGRRAHVDRSCSRWKPKRPAPAGNQNSAMMQDFGNDGVARLLAVRREANSPLQGSDHMESVSPKKYKHKTRKRKGKKRVWVIRTKKVKGAAKPT